MKTKTDSNSEQIIQTQPTFPAHIEVVVKQSGRDVRDAILVVSLLVNIFLFTAWLVLQVTTRFDAALLYYLQSR